ncbi:BON domain-containing protein [Variovorax sp. ZT4R33]|uniref:BON domain-containing protein n=1 Tax=Variovorax sp. ZT4R33 TaxID=3443743 RepID=UPI003F48546E
MALAACGERNDGRTAGEKVDAAIAKTQDVAGRAADKAQGLAEVARDKVVAAEPAIRDGAAAAGQAAREAGVAVTKTADDMAISAAVSKDLAKDPELSAARIDVDTHGGAVKLQGPAPSATAKTRAGDIAKAVKGVQRVDNALEVKPM